MVYAFGRKRGGYLLHGVAFPSVFYQRTFFEGKIFRRGMPAVEKQGHCIGAFFPGLPARPCACLRYVDVSQLYSLSIARVSVGVNAFKLMRVGVHAQKRPRDVHRRHPSVTRQNAFIHCSFFAFALSAFSSSAFCRALVSRLYE